MIYLLKAWILSTGSNWNPMVRLFLAVGLLNEILFPRFEKCFKSWDGTESVEPFINGACNQSFGTCWQRRLPYSGGETEMNGLDNGLGRDRQFFLFMDSVLHFWVFSPQCMDTHVSRSREATHAWLSSDSWVSSLQNLLAGSQGLMLSNMSADPRQDYLLPLMWPFETK